MTGCVFKRKLPSGRITWGYSIDIGRSPDGKRQQIFKSGFETKGAAKDALDKALQEQEVHTGRITQEKGILGRRVWAFAVGVERDTGFSSKAAAESALRAARERIEADKAAAALVSSPATVPTRGPTLGDFFAEWIEHHAVRNCAPKTVERYRELGLYFLRDLGASAVNELRTVDIQSAIHRLSDAGGKKTLEYPDGRPLSAKTVRHIGTLLYTCLSEAERLGVMTIPHPMANKRVKLPRLLKRKPAVIDAEKLSVLFERARETRLFPFVVLAASTGCRRGELLALEWSDIDLNTGELTVSKSLEQTKAGLRVKSTKSGESRNFVIPEPAIEALKVHQVEQNRDRALFGKDYEDHGLVFCQPGGGFYSPDRQGARVAEIMRKAGLQGVSLHSLRHSCASLLLSNGVPLAVVSEQLGHADQNITLSIYSHAIPADKRAASKVWSGAMADVIQTGRKPPTTGMFASVCTEREKSKGKTATDRKIKRVVGGDDGARTR